MTAGDGSVLVLRSHRAAWRKSPYSLQKHMFPQNLPGRFPHDSASRRDRGYKGRRVSPHGLRPQGRGGCGADRQRAGPGGEACGLGHRSSGPEDIGMWWPQHLNTSPLCVLLQVWGPPRGLTMSGDHLVMLIQLTLAAFLTGSVWGEGD